MKKVSELVDPQWRLFFEQELSCAYMSDLRHFLSCEKTQGKIIYPPSALWFNAFYQTPFDNIKVVIVGQDPYHGIHQAHGLSFSVPNGVPLPPSLKNIFNELTRDIGMSIPGHGNLQAWAQQGVFLLNSVLTVEQFRAGSHAKKGWEKFSQAAIDYINGYKTAVVFLAWGRYAHEVCANIDRSKHLVIKTSHPSPLGAYKQGGSFSAFIGSSCFSQANKWLEEKKLKPIDWACLN